MIGKPAEVVAFAVVRLEVRFNGLNRDFVPEGRPKKQRNLSTADQCQTACASDERCKAYAFRAAERTCYLYSKVFIGGTRTTR